MCDKSEQLMLIENNLCKDCNNNIVLSCFLLLFYCIFVQKSKYLFKE
jgi:hypothetical protein